MSRRKMTLSVVVETEEEPNELLDVAKKEFGFTFGSNLVSVELVERIELDRPWIDVPLPGLES